MLVQHSHNREKFPKHWIRLGDGHIKCHSRVGMKIEFDQHSDVQREDPKAAITIYLLDLSSSSLKRKRIYCVIVIE